MENDEHNDNVLSLILEGRNDADIQQKKLAEKTAANSSSRACQPPSTVSRLTATRTVEGMDDNLAKVLARRSQGMAIGEEDLFFGHGNEEVVIDFGPEDNDGLPGAYKGAPGADYGRIEKTPLPQQLRGDATQRQPAEDEKESDNPPGETETAQEWSFRDVDQTESARKKRAKIFLVTSGILLLLLAIILPIVLLLRGTDGKQEAQVDTPESQPAEEIILVPNLTQSTLKALKDRFSYQASAYDWVEDDPNWATYEPWRKQQRFVMACVYAAFSLSAPFSINSFHWKWMKHDANECDWQGQLQSGACDHNGKIVILDFSRINPMQGWVGSGSFEIPPIPPEIVLLPMLETIMFSATTMDKDMDSLLPLEVINSLPALKTLELSSCKLQGSIPSTLGLLTTLTALDLSQNALTSTIPSELGLIPHLNSLTLSWNDLSGTIPNRIGGLPFLSKFSVDNNALIEPTLPNGFCTGNHTAMELLSTDWCSSIDDCC